MPIPGKFVDRAHERRAINKLTLDVDSSVSETHGQQ